MLGFIGEVSAGDFFRQEIGDVFIEATEVKRGRVSTRIKTSLGWRTYPNEYGVQYVDHEAARRIFFYERRGKSEV